MTQKLFANFTNISEGSLSGVYNGRTKPTLQMVDAIHQHLPQISLEWLLYGVGAMYVDQNRSGKASADDTTDAGGGVTVMGSESLAMGVDAD